MLASPKLNVLSVLALVTCIATSFIGVNAQSTCTLSNKGFIGTDLGSIVFVAYEYDLHVTKDTKQNVITTEILPAVKNTLVTFVTPLLIVECAPLGADTSAFADVVGIETQPKDKILATDGCKSPASDSQDCYRIHSEFTIYVSDTGTDVETVVWLAILQFFTIQDASTMVLIHPDLKNLAVDGTSWVAPTSPSAAFQPNVPKINLLEATEGLRGKGRGGILGFFDSIYNNKVLFWWLIGGISFVVVVLLVVLFYYWYKLHKEGKTLSEGCKEGCDACKGKCDGCKGKCDDCCGKVKNCCRQVFCCECLKTK